MVMSVKKDIIQIIEYRGHKYVARTVSSGDIGYPGDDEWMLADELLQDKLRYYDDDGNFIYFDEEAELLDEQIFGFLSEKELSQTYEELCNTCKWIFL